MCCAGCVVASEREFRRSSSLAAWFDGNRLTVVNYQMRRAFRCASDWVDFVLGCDDVRGEADLLSDLSERGIEKPQDILVRLIDFGILLPVGGQAEAEDAEWQRRWRWGHTAGLFHYSTRDIPWATGDEETEYLRKIAEEGGEPELWEDHPISNGTSAHIIDLPDIDLSGHFLALATRRRTCRDLDTQPISLSSVAHCMYAGLGFNGFLDLPLRPRLPLKLTPSGGARNPFEGYLVSRAVNGLTPGVYHYSGAGHTLRRVADGEPPALATFLGGQCWADNSAAVVLLVARFERTMYKYRLPSAYSSVLIEAGHIAQNIVLAATESDLASATTGALDHSAAEHVVGESDLLHAAVYAVVLGAGHRQPAQ